MANMSQSSKKRLPPKLKRQTQCPVLEHSDLAHAQIAVKAARTDRKQAVFCLKIRALIQKAVAEAERQLSGKPEHYEFHEVSGNYIGHPYVHHSACNPVAYDLCDDGMQLGETLLVRLTQDGMIEALLVPRRPGPAVPRTRVDIGWQPVPIRAFSAAIAADLVAWYVAAITNRISLDDKP
jgi:hypothetical protein